jgi:branched-chain amino acid transport system substrate-binding protein
MLAAAAALLMLAPGCRLTSDAGGGTQDVVIAADLELSGSAAAVGTAYERALRLKVDQINAGGSLGHRKLKLVVRDNHTDARQSVTNVTELVGMPGVAAIVTGVCSDCLLAVASIINDKRIPTIALAPGVGVASPVEQRPYIFQLAPNPADSAAALGSELTRTGVHDIGVLATNDSYGDDGQQAMARDAQKAGINVVARSQVRPSDTDLVQAVQRLVERNPDALVVWALPSQAGLAAKTARDAGFAGKIYFDAAAAGDLFLTGPTAAATEGATMVFTQTLAIDDVIATTPARSARQQWFRDYISRYGSYYGYASFAADAVQIIANAIGRAGGVESDRIRAIMEDTQIDGLTGPIRLAPDNHSGLKPQALTMLVARGGRWRLVG